MEVLQGLENLYPSPQPRAVCVGAFDGFHIGHQYLLSQLCEVGWENGLESCIVTFEPIPAQYFAGPTAPPRRLTSPEERIALAASLCCDLMAVLNFNKELAQVTAEDFCREILVQRLHMQLLMASATHTMGHDRADMNRIKEIGERLGFQVIPSSTMQLGELRVSSTEIRRLLGEGHVEEAASLLGRHYSVSGTVVQGEGRGRGLGFPTANLQVPAEKLLPADAVYAAVAVDEEVGGPEGVYAAAVSIGNAPTFGGRQRVVEAHLITAEELDLTGRPMRLEFVRRLRWQERFENAEALSKQIAHDVEATLRLCGGLVQCANPTIPDGLCVNRRHCTNI